MLEFRHLLCRRYPMGCDTGVKERPKQTAAEAVQTENNKSKEKKMSSSMVLRKMPEFTMDAFDAKSGHYTSVKSENYAGKWTVVCFYPADFTFVCPTEIAAMNANLDKLNELGVVVLPVSGDTKFSHKILIQSRWCVCSPRGSSPNGRPKCK